MVRSSRPRPCHRFIDAYGLRASHVNWNFQYLVNMHLIKYPQLAMQCNKRWGHDFYKELGGKTFKPLDPIKSSQLSMREPIKPSTTHVEFGTQSFIASRGTLQPGMGEIL